MRRKNGKLNTYIITVEKKKYNVQEGEKRQLEGQEEPRVNKGLRWRGRGARERYKTTKEEQIKKKE